MLNVINNNTMSRICDICGKKPVTSDTSRHNTTKNISAHGGWALRAVKTKKTVKPNLRKLKLPFMRPIKTCMSCYKSPRMVVMRDAIKTSQAVAKV